MSDRELVRCEWCGVYLRDTYFNVLGHRNRCRGKADREYYEKNRLPKPYLFECSKCWCLLIYKGQEHSCPSKK